MNPYLPLPSTIARFLTKPVENPNTDLLLRQKVSQSTKRSMDKIRGFTRANVTFQECPTCKRMIKTIGGKMIPHHKYRDVTGRCAGKWCGGLAE